MAADRRRLAALQGLSAWQATARQQVHELRTPLTAARLALDRLDAALGAPGEGGAAPGGATRRGDGPAVAAVDDLRGELGRLGEQARRLADFARLPPPQPRLWDLDRLARDILHTYRDVWPGTELVAAGGGEVPVEVDRDLLRQVLVNLCENAAQAGARRVVLRWGSVSSGGGGGAGNGGEEGEGAGGAWLTVADDGPGVPAALAERIFEPYVSGRGDGSGLGLAICRKILLDHGGDLELDHGAGADGDDGEKRGAVFRLTLPAAAAATPPATAVPA
jgi:signal transduction histidine kinase